MTYRISPTIGSDFPIRKFHHHFKFSLKYDFILFLLFLCSDISWGPWLVSPIIFYRCNFSTIFSPGAQSNGTTWTLNLRIMRREAYHYATIADLTGVTGKVIKLARTLVAKYVMLTAAILPSFLWYLLSFVCKNIYIINHLWFTESLYFYLELVSFKRYMSSKTLRQVGNALKLAS